MFRRPAVHLVVAALAAGTIAVGGADVAFAAVCPAIASGTPTITPNSGIDWSGCTLDGAFMASANLANANLKSAGLTLTVLFGANLANANLANTTVTTTIFDGANLVGANLASAHGTKPTFVGANLTGANLVLANLTQPSFLAAGLNDANFVEFKGSLADFSGTTMIGANLSGAFVPGAKFRGANLTNANLTDADISFADLTGANLTGAMLTGVTWTGVTCPNGTKAIQHINQRCTTALDKVAPVASITSPAAAFSTSRTLTFAYTATEVGNTGVRYTARWARRPVNGGPLSAWTIPPSYSNTALTSYTIANATGGYRYCLEVRATDGAGNVGAWSSPRCTNVPLDERAFTANSKWTQTSEPTWFDGTKSTATAVGAKFTSSGALHVREIGVVATKCPTCGSITVKVGATTVGTISLVGALDDRALVKLPRLAATTTGVVTLTVATSGKKVAIDAIAFTSF